MSKKNTRLKEIGKAAVLIVIVGGFVILSGFSLVMSTYSAAPAVMYSGSYVFVSGHVEYDNGTDAAGLTIDLFATDELFHDVLTTDEQGRFLSLKQFESGQIIRVDILEQRFTRFIDYFVEGDDFNLGLFIVRPE